MLRLGCPVYGSSSLDERSWSECLGYGSGFWREKVSALVVESSKGDSGLRPCLLGRARAGWGDV